MGSDIVVSRIVDVSLVSPPGGERREMRALRILSDSRGRSGGVLPARTLAGWPVTFDPRGDGEPRAAQPLIDLACVTPNPLDPRLVMLHAPESESARRYRLLRHRLLFNGNPRVVLVTSANAGEGKTTCALNLALALAEDAVTRVLALDLNLLRPAFGRFLRFSPSARFAAQITHTATPGPPYSLAALDGTRLHVAGLPDPPLAMGRLDRASFVAAVCDLRQIYDYIVIDGASVLESGDVNVVAECASGVILAALAGRSRKGDMRRALAELAPAPVLGTVLLDA
jgi:Mrp family chromosome partitioning ATPase